MKFCPIASVSFCESASAIVSMLPPGHSGTIKRTGRVGYAWARAISLTHRHSNVQAMPSTVSIDFSSVDIDRGLLPAVSFHLDSRFANDARIQIRFLFEKFQ